MDFLVTGATGFIGSRLVERLLADGHEVNYLVRKRSITLDSRAAFHPWNSGDIPPLDSVPTIDAVINLAGEPVAQRWNDEVKRRIHASRVNGTRLLVEGLGKLRHKPAVLISASATGYYGARGDEILTETSSRGSGFLPDLCADWEREALRAGDFGIRVVLIRIAPVIGPAGGILAKALPIFRSGFGGRLGNGRQWMPWIHIDDVVEMLVLAATQADARGAWNATAPNPVTNAQFTSALAAAVRRPAWFPVPRFALRLAMGEAADAMLESQRVIPEKASASGFQFRYAEIGPALRAAVEPQT